MEVLVPTLKYVGSSNLKLMVMIVYHVTCLKKLNRYLKSGQINPPVRAWENIEQANRMSLSTGRRIILRLKFPDNTPKLEGHFNQARVLQQPYKITNNNY